MMNKDVKAYIDAQPSPQKEICKKVRSVLLKTFPDIEEGMKWGVPAYGEGTYYIVALKNHVNLGFSTKGLTKKEKELFDGGGTTTRHIEIDSVHHIDEKRIITLLKLVKSKQGV